MITSIGIQLENFTMRSKYFSCGRARSATEPLQPSAAILLLATTFAIQQATSLPPSSAAAHGRQSVEQSSNFEGAEALSGQGSERVTNERVYKLMDIVPHSFPKVAAE